ncbi:uncharacterized protein ARMOST_00027 [Armillaria ostoyae]|uniref:Uncharacterized protein n=1 Tax=Armillaria ostoyae TaxID=47428 RepID=A0A284QJZ9_ARMOS|nr:uncharacterized protein ARMOST_00027 [Armillaria ostoyae]
MSFISFASVIVLVIFSRHPFSQYRLPSSSSTTLLFLVHRQVASFSNRSPCCAHRPHDPSRDLIPLENLANQYGTTDPDKLVRLQRLLLQRALIPEAGSDYLSQTSTPLNPSDSIAHRDRVQVEKSSLDWRLSW